MIGSASTRAEALAAIIEAITDPVFLKDAEGRFVIANSACARVLGAASPAALVGVMTSDLLPPQSARQVIEQDRSLLETGESRTFEEVVTFRTGETRSFLTTKVPFRDAGGAIVGLIGISRDITERKQAEERLRISEERFRGMIEQAPFSVQLLAADGRTLEVNAAWKRLWGDDPEFLRQVLGDYRVTEDSQLVAKGVMPYIQAAFEGRVSDVPAIFYDPTELKGGKGRWVEGHLYPIKGATGELREVVLMHNDITARKEAEQERERLMVEESAARVRAEAALAAREEFLAMAAHELRTPLTPIKMQLFMLARHWHDVIAGHPKAAVLAEVLENTNRQVERLTNVVNDMIEVSRIATGELRLRREPCDLEELVRGVVARRAAEIEHSESDVRLQTTGGIRGNWDRAKIERAVESLLANALKFGEGKPIDVCAERADGRARLLVRDRGIGIAPENLARIFDRFERAVSTRHFGGLGLGLYVAREIVTAHEGTIRVESEPGQGATFIMELPPDEPAPRSLQGST